MIITPSTPSRRVFLRTAGVGLAALARPALPLFAEPSVSPATVTRPESESAVKLLYASLKPEQRKQICFGWDYKDPKRGLLRTRLENNWTITKPIVKSDFYTLEQQAMIRSIFEGMTNPDWHQRFDRQLADDVGGFGVNQSIAIFGAPGSGKFEFVLASRHMTLRCDGDSADHVAFGGPILYAHEGDDLHEKPHHPHNVFWHQAVEANKLYHMLDAKQDRKSVV